MIRIERFWEMPHRYTFSLRSVKYLFREEFLGKPWVDPFSGKHSPAHLRNDIDPKANADFHQDGLEFLRSQPLGSFAGIIFDPPYSTEQALRSYKGQHHGTAGREEYIARCLDAGAKLVKEGGKAIRFGWQSCGFGKRRGFELNRLMVICHGAAHYDTLVTVETKTPSAQLTL